MIAALLAGGPGTLLASGATGDRDILAGLQRFFLAYSGVFALVALTAAVVAGLIATDRLVLTPAGRVAFQAVHRALSLTAVGFLTSHVLLEVLAHRSSAIDAVVPFLASGRTLYLGLGTLASDLVLLIVFTGIARRKFATHGTAVWRAVHLTAYLAWPLAILHGLLSGRPAKPYVGWSYGACVAVVALALIIRVVATTRSRTDVVPHPATDQVSQGLPAPLFAAGQPGAWPSAQPGAWPSAQPGAWSSAQPGAWPSAQPGAWSSAQPGAWSSVQPPPPRALPGGTHDGTIQYGVVDDGRYGVVDDGVIQYGVVDDGVPRASGTP